MESTETTNPVIQPEGAGDDSANAEKLIHQLDKPSSNGKPLLIIVFAFIIVGAGIFTGYRLSRGQGKIASDLESRKLTGEAELIATDEEVGIKDESVFSDEADGRIEVNDFSVSQEGTHILVRSGGASQTAYLSSTVVDLDQFVGKCVHVWGETSSAKTAGWLMDVGRIRLLDKCPEGV